MADELPVPTEEYCRKLGARVWAAVYEIAEIKKPEKDCRTCEHIHVTELRTYYAYRCQADAQCILGSRYERAEFQPLWRTE